MNIEMLCPTEVVVCGDGLFAILVNSMLSQAGVRTRRIHSSPSGTSLGFPGLGVLWPTPVDPFTRIAVAHGATVARELSDFVRGSCAAWNHEPPNNHVPQLLVAARSLRLASAPHEVVELKAAARDYQSLRPLDGLDPSVFALDEGTAWITSGKGADLAQVLLATEDVQSHCYGVVTHIEESADGVKVYCQDGRCYQAEIGVVGLGAATGKVIARFGDICVPVTDVISQMDLGVSLSDAQANDIFKEPLDFKGVCFRTANGHISGVVRLCRPTKEVGLKLTGPRYALRHAGAGWSAHEMPADGPWLNAGLLKNSHLAALHALSVALPEWEPALRPAIQRLDSLSEAQVLSTVSLGTECWPCDELPLLGDFGNHGRLVGSAGWLGCGHGVALWAARATCDLILKGRISSVPEIPILSPRRFFLP